MTQDIRAVMSDAEIAEAERLQDRCKDCKNICEKVERRFTCKLNFVNRHPLDNCMWDTKRDPSKFEQRCYEDESVDIIEELERYLIWQGGLVDDEDKRNGYPPSDVVLNKIAELKKKWGWL